MSSTKQGGNHLNVYGGVDTSSKPHLVEPNLWLTGTNVRFFNGATQMPRKKVLCKMRSDTSDPIIHLSAIPKENGRSLLVAMSAKQIWAVPNNTGNNVGVEILRDNNILEFNNDSKYRRWGTVMYKNHLYFTNELNSLRYTDGAACYKLGENIPGGRYVSNVYDHMWLGWVRKDGHTYPTRLHWSHLYNFSQWDPAPTAETDFYDFEEFCSTDLPVRGITGLGKLGTSLVAYTPSAILAVRYVGLPKIVNVEPLALDIGNGLPWTLVALQGRHYFFDLKTFNFYRFTGEELTPIGNAIQTWLANTIKTTTPDDLATMWGFYDGVNKEVTWVFRSTASASDLDAYVTFNETSGKWTHGYCENIHAFCPGSYRARTIGELAGTQAGSLTGKAGDLGVGANQTFPRMFGAANAAILREEIAADSVADFKYVPPPVLETPDYVYGDIDKVKEIESMVIHAEWTTAVGLKVEYSTRDNLEGNVVWNEISQRWTPSLPEKRLSFPRISGRIFRFRFTPVQVAASTTTTTTNVILSPGFSIRAELEGTGEVTPPDDDEDEPPPNDAVEFKRFNGPVYHVLESGEFVYVCGRFNQYGSNVEGWQNCKGIARIKKVDGSLDTTFQPGGVAGGGFDITYPYFAPTQMQGAADGGVFVAMSFWNLPEPRLYTDRGEPTCGNYEALSLNGVAVPPLIKLSLNGARDNTFVTNYITGAATNPVFMSFHAHESANAVYLTYQRNVNPVVEDVVGAAANIGGDNKPVLEKRTLTGTLTQLNFIRSSLDFNAAGPYTTCHMVFVDEQTGLVYWSGINSNVTAVGSLVQCKAGVSNVGTPLGWRQWDIEYPSAVPGLLVFDLNLAFKQAADWAANSFTAADAGYYTRMVPQIITRGCFRGSLVGSQGVVGDPVGSPFEGRWRSSPTGQHKGCLHFCFTQAFTGDGLVTGSGDGAIALTYMGSGGVRGYTPYHTGVAAHNVWYAKGTPDDFIITGPVGSEVGDYWINAPPDPDGPFSFEIGVPGVVSLWEVYSPRQRAMVAAPTHLWDLRGSVADMEDTTKHGFDPFFGASLDDDGCQNCRVLKSQYDGSTLAAGPNTPSTLGVFITGPLEKFKGVTIATAKNQLFKLSHGGSLLTSFVPPTFGPVSFTLKRDISSGVDETHYEKINCLTLSATGRVAYVGGKFTEITVNGVVTNVGHIVCLDANTGEVLS